MEDGVPKKEFQTTTKTELKAKQRGEKNGKEKLKANVTQ